jgi:hypothetical protein
MSVEKVLAGPMKQHFYCCWCGRQEPRKPREGHGPFSALGC